MHAKIHLPKIPLSRSRFSHQTAPGARPGTIVVRPDAPPPTITVVRYGSEKHDVQTDVSIDDLPSLLDTHAVTWVNVDGLGDANVLKKIAELFDIHRLALEDVVNVHQRAKLEAYDNNIYVVARMVGLNTRVEIEQLSLFIGPKYVVTFQERPGDCFDVVRDRLKVKGRPIRKSGADYLAYALLDAVVDAYFPVLDEYGQRLDVLDEHVGESVDPEVMAQIHALRADVRLLLRSLRPHREVVRRMMDEAGDLVSDEIRLYLRDVHDHVVQLVDLLETYREQCSDLRDYYLSAVSNRMNEVMKVLTIIATIFIPLSFIAGLYGMNFDSEVSSWNMPELHWPWGYPFVITVMLATAGGMLWFFRRRGWIGGAAPLKPFDGSHEPPR